MSQVSAPFRHRACQDDDAESDHAQPRRAPGQVGNSRMRLGERRFMAAVSHDSPVFLASIAAINESISNPSHFGFS